MFDTDKQVEGGLFNSGLDVSIKDLLQCNDNGEGTISARVMDNAHVKRTWAMGTRNNEIFVFELTKNNWN